MSKPNDGPRARYRQQVRDEVRARAWEQIGHDGVTALSLKAIATQMGMTAPALYRYYGSRDELLTELILDAYQDLAECVEAAAHGNSSADRLTAVAQAMWAWAIAQPQRYLLLYGTPVPGYHAPESATQLARRIFAPILAGFGHVAEAREDRTPPTDALRRSVLFWTRLHGVLSLQLAGHFDGMNVDAEQLYRDEVCSLVGVGAG